MFGKNLGVILLFDCEYFSEMGNFSLHSAGSKAKIVYRVADDVCREG